MDRLDAMKVFVVTVDEGSLAAAGRKLGRSPAAVSRAIAFLEARAGAELLHRTTRSIKLSEEGERYAETCRRVLSELDQVDVMVGGGKSAPRGTLTLTGPVLSGELVLQPILDAFLDATPTVSARLFLLDRFVNLIDEGIDVALRIGNLADSAMVAVHIGEVRRLLVAAPRYLKQNPAHHGTARPGQAPDHRDGAHSQFMDLSAAPRLLGAANGAVHAAACDQQHPRRGGLRGRRTRRRAAVFVSGGRACASRRAGGPAQGAGARAAAGPLGGAAWQACGAAGARFHGFRDASAS